MTDLRDHAGGIAALAVVVGLYAASGGAQLAPVPGLSDRFAFEAVPIVTAAPTPERSVRPVHPAFAHIEAWISSVGAAVSLGDLDGDGVASDICLVDPRGDAVTVQPLPVPEARAVAARILYHPGAPEAGPDVAPMGCLFGDLDRDGALDVLVYFWGRQPVLYRGGVGLSGFAAATPFGADEIWFTNSAVLADVDGDGRLDAVFGNYFPTGGGVLDVSGRRPVEMQHSMSRARNGGANRLFMNRSAPGAPRFVERPEALPAETLGGWTLALGAAELTGDGAPELYVANDFGPDRLLINRGDGQFALVEGRRGLADIRSGVLGRDSFKGMGVDFGDLNGDGRFDIAVSNIAEPYALHESHLVFLSREGGWEGGQVPLGNAAGALGLARSGWGWDIKMGDFDNDGELEVVQATGFVAGTVDRWPELHELAMGNDELLRHPRAWPAFRRGDGLSFERHDPFYARGPDGVFRDVAPEIGLGGASISRGIALGDVDGDGDLDMVVARQWSPSVLYLNTAPSDGEALVLDLALSNPDGSIRSAVGASVLATLPDGRRLLRQLDVSNGHSGGNSAQVHLGLGDTEGREVALQVRWRSDGALHSRDYRLPPGRHRLVLDQFEAAQVGTEQGAPGRRSEERRP